MSVLLSNNNPHALSHGDSLYIIIGMKLDLVRITNSEGSGYTVQPRQRIPCAHTQFMKIDEF